MTRVKFKIGHNALIFLYIYQSVRGQHVDYCINWWITFKFNRIQSEIVFTFVVKIKVLLLNIFKTILILI